MKNKKEYKFLNEKNIILLNNSEWKIFCNQLVQKAKFRPTLHHLLTKPSVFSD